MKGPFKVFLQGKPLTVGITDENRAALAYSMLYAAGEEYSLIDGQEYDPKNLTVLDGKGNAFKPELDSEWYGNASLYFDQTLDNLMKKAADNGESVSYIEAYQRMTSYSVIPKGLNAYIDGDAFIPATCSKDKAMEMANFLQYGLDPGITLRAMHYNVEFEDYEAVPVTPDAITIIDGHGQNVDIVSDPEWAWGQMDPDLLANNAETQAFAEAIASLPMPNERRMKNRLSMVEECYDRMASHSDPVLTEKVSTYFDKNRTMPGEKAIKDIAKAQYKAMTEYRKGNRKWEWNQNVPAAYRIDKDDFMHQMSEIAVKDVELHGKSRPRPLIEGIADFEEFLAGRMPDTADETSHVHEFKCKVEGEGLGQELIFSPEAKGFHFKNENYYAASVPHGFASNHPHMTDMTGIITAVDKSKGRSKGSANLMFSIDLMQEQASSITKDQKPAELDHDLNLNNDDDFEKAVLQLTESRPFGKQKQCLSFADAVAQIPAGEQPEEDPLGKPLQI